MKKSLEKVIQLLQDTQVYNPLEHPWVISDEESTILPVEELITPEIEIPEEKLLPPSLFQNIQNVGISMTEYVKYMQRRYPALGKMRYFLPTTEEEWQQWEDIDSDCDYNYDYSDNEDEDENEEDNLLENQEKMKEDVQLFSKIEKKI